MTNVTTETKKSVTIVDKAVKALDKVNNDLTKAMAQLPSLSDIYTELLFNIEAKSSELADISKKVEIQEYEAKVDLGIRVKENEYKVLTKLLKDRDLAEISDDTLNALKTKAERVEVEVEREISSAVAKVRNSMTAAHSQELVELKAAHSVESAELQSDNTSLNHRIQFLTESNQRLENMLDEERKARVEVSRNSSQPTINVSSAK